MTKWSWDPAIPLVRERNVYKVTASDAEHAGQGCDLAGALKARPETFPDNGNWTQRRDKHGFALGPLVTAIARVHLICARDVDLDEALKQAKAGFKDIHRGWRQYLDHALDRYFEYHESREQELGPLRYLDLFNEIAIKPGSTIMAWGHLYENESGIREIRRLRFDRAQKSHTVWADFAAHIAAEVSTGRPVRSVFVTEVGLLDGMESHVIVGATPEQARTNFELAGRPKALSLLKGTTRTPGHDCEGCKYTGGCPDLFTVNGMLQLDKAAAWSRSVSANDLTSHDQCPSQWYMQRLLHLPRESESSDGLRRGSAAHEWIEQAHNRRIACRPGDLPGSPDGLRPVGINSTEDDYLLALPYLTHHIEVCPLRDENVEVVHTERNLYRRDAPGDVVVAVKPDLVLRKNNTLVVREVKTTHGLLPPNATDARDMYLQVSFDLVMLAHGLAEGHGCSNGEVQLEVLTPTGGAVYSYSTDDIVTMKIVRRRIKQLAGDWAHDTTWSTKPGPHCTGCSVRRWCPDRDVHSSGSARTIAADMDQPPF